MNYRNAVFLSGEYGINLNFFSVNKNFAFLGFVNAAQYLNQRGFARAVFAEQRVDFARFQLQLHIFQCINARKALMNILHFKQHVFAHLTSPFFKEDRF